MQVVMRMLQTAIVPVRVIVHCAEPHRIASIRDACGREYIDRGTLTAKRRSRAEVGL